MAHRFARVMAREPAKKFFGCGCQNFKRTYFAVVKQHVHDHRATSRTWPVLYPHTYSLTDESYLEKSSSYYKTKYLIYSPIRIFSLYPHDWTVVRLYSVTPRRWKEESTVEKSVKAMKDSIEEQAKDPVPDEPKVAVVLPIRKSLWQRFVGELKHYYHGFRLLFIDIKITGKLLWSVLNGSSLNRREYKQLIRTTSDLFRLVPFMVFISVPFMEFLLPVAIKLFPSMLPSTFAEENKVQEKLKKQLKVRLEMAKFLQDTIEDSALQGKKSGKTSMAEEFSTFVHQIRSTGQPVATKDIMRFSKLFEDEITLDNLSHGQLQALCRVLNVSTLGTDNFLRFQLRMKLRQLKADDKMIQKEGIESLTIWELQGACRARGMRAVGLSEERLKLQLSQWLDQHLNEKIPPSLLLLSRALYLPETLSTPEQLKETISALPESTAEEAKIKIAEMTGERIDNKAKRTLIQLEEEAIQKEKQELEQQELREEEIRAKQEMDMAEAMAAKSAMETVEVSEQRDETMVMEAKPGEELKDVAADIDKITSKDLEEIELALEEIAEQKKMHIQEEELEDLKEDVSMYREDLEDLKAVIVSSGGGEQDIRESKAAKRLTKRVDGLITQLDEIITELHKEKDQIQEEIEVGEVKIKRSQELKDDMEKREEMMSFISERKGDIISINDMVLALKRLQKVDDEGRLQRIVEVLDDDHDGQIEVNHVLKVIELLGRENIKLEASQVSEVVELLKREATLEEEERLKEKLEKQK